MEKRGNFVPKKSAYKPIKFQFDFNEPQLPPKVLKKMMNYRMTSFNFILDEDISKKKDIDGEKSGKKSLENFINLSEDDYPQSNNINNKNLPYNKPFKGPGIKFNKNKIGDMQNRYTNKNDFCISSITGQERNNDIRINDKILNKKINRKHEFPEEPLYINDDEDIKEVQNDVQANTEKQIIIKLIEKYSYHFIFSLFLKKCAEMLPELDKNDDREAEDIIKSIVKNLGVEEVMKIILSIGNSKNQSIILNPPKKTGVQKKLEMPRTNSGDFDGYIIDKEEDIITKENGKNKMEINSDKENLILLDDDIIVSNENEKKKDDNEKINLDEDSESLKVVGLEGYDAEKNKENENENDKTSKDSHGEDKKNGADENDKLRQKLYELLNSSKFDVSKDIYDLMNRKSKEGF